jgi:uncharacterized RDD family membrane protein YckC
MTTSWPATSPAEPQLADLWRRVAARCIDAVTVLSLHLTLVLVGLASVIDAASDRWAPDPWGRALVATITYAAITVVYEVVFLAVRGQTPGKDLLDIKVVEVATLDRPRWWVALVRTLPIVALRLVPGVVAGTVAVLALGVSAPARRRRGVHDLLAGTMVVYYDAAAMEPESVPEPIDRGALAATYGPRRLADLLQQRGRRVGGDRGPERDWRGSAPSAKL